MEDHSGVNTFIGGNTLGESEIQIKYKKIKRTPNPKPVENVSYNIA